MRRGGLSHAKSSLQGVDGERAGCGSGRVAASRCVIHASASTRVSPHISPDGCRPEQHVGRRGSPKIIQRRSAPNCTQRTPAGFPLGIPGIGLEMDGAMQQAPHASRQA
jgi:hypothetical protein